MLRIQTVCWLISCYGLLALGACGYQFSGKGAVLPDVNRLFISLLENRSTETGLDILLTNDLKNEFIQKYGGTLAKSDAEAATLSGRITGVKTWTVSRTGAVTAQERRIAITVDVRLKDAAGKTIRSAGDVSADGTYAVVSGDNQATDENRQNAIVSLSKEIAEAVFHRLTEDF